MGMKLVVDMEQKVETAVSDKQREFVDRMTEKLQEFAMEESGKFLLTGECNNPEYRFADWIENSGELVGEELEMARLLICGMNVGVQLDNKFKKSLKFAELLRSVDLSIKRE